MSFDEMMSEVSENGVPVHELDMVAYSGLYIDGNIILNKKLQTSKERLPILAEEYGHHLTCDGNNILCQDSELNRKLERQGKKYAYKKLTNFKDIIEAYDKGIRTLYDMADYFNVTEKFLIEMFESAKERYGIYKDVDGRKIYFIPCVYIS